MDSAWVYRQDGKALGPVGLDDLVDLVLTSLPETTLVRSSSLDHWVPANEVPEIAAEIPPPLPQAALGEVSPSQADLPDFATVPEMLRTVLIADENPAFRKFLSLPLLAQGFTVHEAADGEQAWMVALQHRPWLVLADVNMPKVDGFEFCRRVRAHSLISRTPMLFVSGSDNYKERYRGLQVGADDFLSKQTPIRELLLRIQLLLTRYSDLGAATPSEPGPEAEEGGAAMEGEIETLGAPAIIQICHQGRLSGILTAKARDRRTEGGAGKVAVFGFREGEIVSATAEEETGPEAVYSFLAWRRGQFSFVAGEPGEGEPIARKVEGLLLEGCRRLDEARRAADED
jgi:CheY-like chemotaxis protein